MSMQQVEPGRAQARAQWQAAIAAAGEALRRQAVVEVPVGSPGWIDSGIDLAAGEAVTLLAAGRVLLLPEPEISFGADLYLWYRIGDRGPIARFAAASASFVAPGAGRLWLVGHYPAAWLDSSGRFDPAIPRAGGSGGWSVAVLVWSNSADEGLARFAAADASGLALVEHARVLEPRLPPRGWQPLWRLGATEIYRDLVPAGAAPRIACQCRENAGIIKFPVELALDDSTRLSWRWRVLELPSQVGEDSLPTHDYLSIAVEFDNGLDLTYMWSAALATGTVFRCPLPWWDQHETHWVLRSGSAALGRWLDEEQPLLADYRRAIGGPAPARVVGVWLIAVAAFQRRQGACEYQGIRLHGAGGSVGIGP